MYIEEYFDKIPNLKDIVLTNHMQSYRRQLRLSYLNDEDSKKIEKCFFVDKGHPNGAEIHILTKNALIIVLNERTKKVCTILIARPGQIRRYYKAINEYPPKYLIDIARKHLINGEHLI